MKGVKKYLRFEGCEEHNCVVGSGTSGLGRIRCQALVLVTNALTMFTLGKVA